MRVFLTILMLLFNTNKSAQLASMTTNRIHQIPSKIDNNIASSSTQIQSFGRKRSVFLMPDKIHLNSYHRKVRVDSGQMNVIYQPFNIRGGGIDLEPNYFKQKTSFEEDQKLFPTSSDYTWLFAKAVIERGFSSLIYLSNAVSELLTITKDYSSVLLESGLERQREKLLLQHNKALLEAETNALAKVERKKENEAKLNRFGNFLQTSWKIFNEGRAKTEYLPLPMERIEKPKAQWNFPKISFWFTPKPENTLNSGILQYLLNFIILLSKFKQK